MPMKIDIANKTCTIVSQAGKGLKKSFSYNGVVICTNSCSWTSRTHGKPCLYVDERVIPSNCPQKTKPKKDKRRRK